MVEYLDWPKIPESLEQIILEYTKNTRTPNTYESYPVDEGNINWDDSIGLSVFSIDRFKYSPAEFAFLLEVPEELTKWVAENIPEPHTMVSIQIMSDGTQILPHVDGYRKVAYNYILTASPETTTCFYDPIEEYKNHKFYSETYIPYERVVLTEEHHLPTNTWHKLDVTKIHSVEKINNKVPRIAVTLSVL